MDDNFEIIFYELDNGTIPVSDFLNRLDTKMQAKAIRTIELLEVNGNQLGLPHSKFLKDSLFELRIKIGSDISRILYFFYVGKKIVLTNGFIKKTQKTPPSEIELAQKYRSDFLKKYSKEN